MFETKKRLIQIAAAAAAIAMSFSAFGCGGNTKGPEPDGFDLTEATPVNTDKYDIPQDYCRTYYEVFVRSFADGNGDGIGDLRGLINNLDYLNDGDDSTTTDLGINGIWMMPIHKSPSYHKYDVIDYYSIDDEYGTIDDFKALVAACDERDIWLQMDLVLNHTSTQHAWFKRALADAEMGLEPQDSSAMQKYTFVHTADKPSSGTWYSVPNSDLWYLGNFSQEMPDVNLANEEVRDEIKKIVDYWLELGVRSFRLDAVPWAFADSVVYNEENGEFWTWFNDYCNKKGKEVYGEKYPGLSVYCYNVGEVLESSGLVVQQFFDTGMSNFNFKYTGIEGTSYISVAAARSASAVALISGLAEIQSDSLSRDENALLSNFISNHDMDRWALTSLFSDDHDKVKVAAGLYLLAPGNPYIYYGEEIGAVGSRGGNSTDANRRLHFNWGDSRNVQDPAGSNYKGEQELGSVLDQTGDKDSILTYYRQAIKLRNRFPEIGRGKMTAQFVNADGKLAVLPESTSPTGAVEINKLNKTIAAYTLDYNGAKTLIVQNVGSEAAEIDLSAFEGYDVVAAVKASGGRVVIKDGKLSISGGIAAVLKLGSSEKNN